MSRSHPEPPSPSQGAGDELESVRRHMSELEAMVRELALGASEATRVAGEAATIGSQALTAVQNLLSTRQYIADAAHTIGEIGHRTRMLALNARIEASRSVEAGAFTVVAEEIKTLAVQTSATALEIKKGVDSTIGEMQSAIAYIDKFHIVAQQVEHYQVALAAAVEEQTISVTAMAGALDAVRTAGVPPPDAEV